MALNKIVLSSLLVVGAISLSLFVDAAYAQVPVGGVSVPVDSSDLFASFAETHLIWLAPAAAAGMVLFKIRPKRK